MGAFAMEDNTTGTNNTAIGHDALANNTTVSNNTAIGSNAMLANTTGYDNVAVGRNALDANVGGHSNTALGESSLTSNTEGDRNVAVGQNALAGNTTGGENVAVGRGALDANTTASGNTAVGDSALGTNITGTKNTAVGGAAGTVCTGAGNTFIGADAGVAVTSGNDNTLLGHDTDNVTSGDSNILIGYGARNNSAGADANIVIGNQVNGAGANTVRFGTSAGTATLTLDGSDTSWAAASDERLKKDIADSTVGLDFIKDLRPVTFKWNAKDAIANTLPKYDASSSDPVYGEGKAHHGFIAQEVKTVIDAHSDVVDGHNLWVEDPDGTQQVAQGALIPMLVKAIQEQNALIEALTTRITTLEG